MADTPTVVVGGQVSGDITSCNKIETQQISSHVDSVFSFKETDTFRSYNTCTGQTIREYSNPSISGAGVLYVIILVAFLVAAARVVTDY